MIDFNLYGMSFVHLSHVKYRRNSKNPTSLENIPDDQILPPNVQKRSISELEIDALASDIINREDILSGRLAVNPGLAALWEEEKQRRRNNEEDSQISFCLTQNRDNVKSTSTHQYFKSILCDKLKTASASEEKSDPNLSVYPAETPDSNELLSATSAQSCNFDKTVLDESVIGPTQDSVDLDETLRPLYEVLCGLKEDNKVEEDSILSQKIREPDNELDELSDEEINLSLPLRDSKTLDISPQKNQNGDLENSSNEDESEWNNSFWNDVRISQVDGNEDSTDDDVVTSTPSRRRGHPYRKNSLKYKRNCKKCVCSCGQPTDVKYRNKKHPRKKINNNYITYILAKNTDVNRQTQKSTRKRRKQPLKKRKKAVSTSDDSNFMVINSKNTTATVSEETNNFTLLELHKPETKKENIYKNIIKIDCSSETISDSDKCELRTKRRGKRTKKIYEAKEIPNNQRNTKYTKDSSTLILIPSKCTQFEQIEVNKNLPSSANSSFKHCSAHKDSSTSRSSSTDSLPEMEKSDIKNYSQIVHGPCSSSFIHCSAQKDSSVTSTSRCSSTDSLPEKLEIKNYGQIVHGPRTTIKNKCKRPEAILESAKFGSDVTANKAEKPSKSIKNKVEILSDVILPSDKKYNINKTMLQSKNKISLKDNISLQNYQVRSSSPYILVNESFDFDFEGFDKEIDGIYDTCSDSPSSWISKSESIEEETSLSSDVVIKDVALKSNVNSIDTEIKELRSTDLNNLKPKSLKVPEESLLKDADKKSDSVAIKNSNLELQLNGNFDLDFGAETEICVPMSSILQDVSTQTNLDNSIQTASCYITEYTTESVNIIPCYEIILPESQSTSTVNSVLTLPNVQQSARDNDVLENKSVNSSSFEVKNISENKLLITTVIDKPERQHNTRGLTNKNQSLNVNIKNNSENSFEVIVEKNNNSKNDATVSTINSDASSLLKNSVDMHRYSKPTPDRKEADNSKNKLTPLSAYIREREKKVLNKTIALKKLSNILKKLPKTADCPNKKNSLQQKNKKKDSDKKVVKRERKKPVKKECNRAPKNTIRIRVKRPKLDQIDSSTTDLKNIKAVSAPIENVTNMTEVMDTFSAKNNIKEAIKKLDMPRLDMEIQNISNEKGDSSTVIIDFLDSILQDESLTKKEKEKEGTLLLTTENDKNISPDLCYKKSEDSLNTPNMFDKNCEDERVVHNFDTDVESPFVYLGEEIDFNKVGENNSNESETKTYDDIGYVSNTSSSLYSERFDKNSYKRKNSPLNENSPLYKPENEENTPLNMENVNITGAINGNQSSTCLEKHKTAAGTEVGIVDTGITRNKQIDTNLPLSEHVNNNTIVTDVENCDKNVAHVELIDINSGSSSDMEIEELQNNSTIEERKLELSYNTLEEISTVNTEPDVVQSSDLSQNNLEKTSTTNSEPSVTNNEICYSNFKGIKEDIEEYDSENTYVKLHLTISSIDDLKSAKQLPEQQINFKPLQTIENILSGKQRLKNSNISVPTDGQNDSNSESESTKPKKRSRKRVVHRANELEELLRNSGNFLHQRIRKIQPVNTFSRKRSPQKNILELKDVFVNISEHEKNICKEYLSTMSAVEKASEISTSEDNPRKRGRKKLAIQKKLTDEEKQNENNQKKLKGTRKKKNTKSSATELNKVNDSSQQSVRLSVNISDSCLLTFDSEKSEIKSTGENNFCVSDAHSAQNKRKCKKTESSQNLDISPRVISTKIQRKINNNSPPAKIRKMCSDTNIENKISSAEMESVESMRKTNKKYVEPKNIYYLTEENNLSLVDKLEKTEIITESLNSNEKSEENSLDKHEIDRTILNKKNILEEDVKTVNKESPPNKSEPKKISINKKSLEILSNLLNKKSPEKSDVDLEISVLNKNTCRRLNKNNVSNKNALTKTTVRRKKSLLNESKAKYTTFKMMTLDVLNDSLKEKALEETNGNLKEQEDKNETKKRRGRPRKLKEQVDKNETRKKRGRPKLSLLNRKTANKKNILEKPGISKVKKAPPKKRGRKKKTIFNEKSVEILTDSVRKNSPEKSDFISEELTVPQKKRGRKKTIFNEQSVEILTDSVNKKSPEKSDFVSEEQSSLLNKNETCDTVLNKNNSPEKTGRGRVKKLPLIKCVDAEEQSASKNSLQILTELANKKSTLMKNNLDDNISDTISRQETNIKTNLCSDIDKPTTSEYQDTLQNVTLSPRKSPVKTKTSPKRKSPRRFKQNISPKYSPLNIIVCSPKKEKKIEESLKAGFSPDVSGITSKLIFIYKNWLWD